MDPLRLRRPENEAVLAYLETEQLPSWRESDSLVVTREDEPARQPLLRRKQLELEALVAGEWTRVDP